MDPQTFAEMRDRLAALERDIELYIQELDAIKRDYQNRTASAAECARRTTSANQGLDAARAEAGELTRQMPGACGTPSPSPQPLGGALGPAAFGSAAAPDGD